MTDHDMIERLYTLRWGTLIIGFLNLATLLALTYLQWSVRQDHREAEQERRLETAGYMDELRLLLKAARTAAESARSNKQDAIHAAGEIKDIASESTKELKREIGKVPEATAERVIEMTRGEDTK